MTAPDLSGYRAIAITGSPRVGKTTLALKLSASLGYQLISTDDYISKTSFKDAPELIVGVLHDLEEPYIVEGVQVARMLKKAHDLGWEPDCVLSLSARISLQSNHKGLDTMVKNALAEWKTRKGDTKVYLVRTY